jgi:hypothetical protein
MQQFIKHYANGDTVTIDKTCVRINNKKVSAVLTAPPAELEGIAALLNGRYALMAADLDTVLTFFAKPVSKIPLSTKERHLLEESEMFDKFRKQITQGT